MRAYLSIRNLRRASAVGAVAALMAMPRILQGGFSLEIHGVAALCVMILAAGAVTAWGASGGMQGAFPSRRRQLCGVAIAIAFALLLLPVQIFWLDPKVRAMIEVSGNANLMELTYPATMSGVLALILWCAGFEAIFFYAATVSFFVRLSGRAWMGVAGACVLRLFAVMKHHAAAGMPGDSIAVVVVPVVGVAVFTAILFSRTGLIPVSVLGALLNAHLLLVDYQ